MAIADTLPLHNLFFNLFDARMLKQAKFDNESTVDFWEQIQYLPHSLHVVQGLSVYVNLRRLAKREMVKESRVVC